VLGSAEFKEEAIETFEEKDIREKLKGRRASYPNRRFAMYACW